MKTSPNKTGIAVAALIAGSHMFWVALVWTGWAQDVISFIFWAHMIQPVYAVRPFDPVAALTLIMITGACGYLLGVVVGALWNWLHRSSGPSFNEKSI